MNKLILDPISVKPTPFQTDNGRGFMHHRSSISALISVIYDWLYALAIDRGQQVCVCVFDVQKVFDSVTHIPLLHKLEEIGSNPYGSVVTCMAERKQYPPSAIHSPARIRTLALFYSLSISTTSESNKINLFADNFALYRVSTAN